MPGKNNSTLSIRRTALLKRLLPLFIFTSLFCTSAIAADDFATSVKQVMKSEHRSQADTKRDRNRMPAQTLSFFGIKEDMKVIELVPGRGWYSKLLAPLLKEKGQLYVGFGTGRIEKILSQNPLFEGIEVTAKQSKLEYNKEERLFDLVNSDLQVKDIDAVLTFRNYHNFTYNGRMAMNKAAFDALKPGGIYGVVDHTRRHMQENDNENHRRVDPILAIKEILESGFEFVDYSSMHSRLDDELRYEVGRKSVTGNTDRFTFLFKKPM
jgi:predicted methyltransferase